MNELLPPGYSFIGEQRSSKRGGGIGILFKTAWNFSKVKNSMKFKTFEVLDVKSTYIHKPIRIIIIYRPPTTTCTVIQFLDELEPYISDIAMAHEQCIIAGDFNIHYEHADASGVQRFKEILAENNLEQHVTGSTHRSGHTLDLVISRSANSAISAPCVHSIRTASSIISDTCIHPSSISDHYSVLFHLATPLPPSMRQVEHVRNYRDLDLVSFETDLRDKLTIVETESDVSTSMENYEETVKSVVDTHAPLTTRERKIRHREPWYNDDIHLARQVRRKNEMKWRRTKLEIHRQIYVHQRTEVNKMIVKAKQAYYETELSTGDQKACFQVINKMVGTSKTALPDAMNKRELCNDFSMFFAEKIEKIQIQIRKQLESLEITRPTPAQHLDITHVDSKLDHLAMTTSDELRRIIEQCPNKTCSLDPMPTELLKKTLGVHLPRVVARVNKSFNEGLFPKCLRTSLVKPIIKKEGLDANQFSNYRPVSNIPFCAKILEKVAVKRLTNHLQENSLLEEYQSAYRALHSTETALLRVNHDIASALDKNYVVLFAMLDLSAAFDTIDQEQLVHVLQDVFGIEGRALSWFTSYLEDRTQRVKIGLETSDYMPLKCGIPQGSVLGPVMFTLYTTPLQEVMKKHGIHYHKYADDIQLYVMFDPCVSGSREAAKQQLQDCIDDIRMWMAKHHLKLNDAKTEVIQFQSKHHLKQYGLTDITIGDSCIEPAAKVRNLGVYFDQHLTMADQVTAVCAACNYHLRRLSSIRQYLTTEATKTAVQALVTSRLDYCNSLLLGLPATQITRLQRIQNKAARLVARTSYSDHITPILRELHWLPVEERIVFKMLVLAFKCLHDLAPAYLCELLQLRSRDSRLRQAGPLILHQPVPHKGIGDHAFGNTAPMHWKPLPDELRAAETVSKFKKLLKTYLFPLN